MLSLAPAPFTKAASPKSNASPYLSRTEDFNRGWRFAKGAQEHAETAAFNDAAWQAVRLPHDWAIYGPYEPEGDPHTGKLPWRGEGWYRKWFPLPALEPGARVYLDFDGVMAMPTIYVNGQKAGGWDYGYMSFRVDATDFIRAGQSNLVSVHVDTRPHSSRWYPGAGIYRKVQLVIKPPTHLAQWGLAVHTTPDTANPTGHVAHLAATVENHSADSVDAELQWILRDPQGNNIGLAATTIAVPANGTNTANTGLTIYNPQLWDLAKPRLYTAVARVSIKGALQDTLETPFGVRTMQFTANDGFHLNGRRVQLYGVCLHSDLGPLGMAFNRRAMERELEIMRDMGVNAIRTSHNPPAPELLDMCDRMGLIVWDECFDKWDGTATLPKGVSIPEHGKKQYTNFVRRDRNHPCVAVWSVGNEIWDLEGLKYPDSVGLLKTMAGFVRELDPTRPVSLAQCVPESGKTDLSTALDVSGWNYAHRYDQCRAKWPNLPIVYSESASAYSTRGYYDDFPLPPKKDTYPPTARISSYDHSCAFYSDPADVEFDLMAKDRFVAGEFVWTGFDYIGEPVPFIAQGWGKFQARQLTPAEESRISSFGIVDLVGIPKDRFYLYRSHWAPEKKTIHILPHWNWPERVGTNTPVYVYTSGDTAELFLNGKSLGRRAKNPASAVPRDHYALRWLDVPYAPGELKAVAYQNGRKLGTATVRTAGEPAKLRLTPDRKRLHADGEDLSYVLVEALDAKGNLCPLAMDDVQFTVTGPGAIAGVGNGDHHFPAEFQTNHVTLFYGKAMLIVRAEEGKGGAIRVRATSDKLAADTTHLNAGK